MPNKPEFPPVYGPGDATWVQKTILAISRFLMKPPGIARIQYNTSGTGPVSIQVTNRVGENNDGRWVVLFFGTNPETGGPWTPGGGFPTVPTLGNLLTALPGGQSWVYITDTQGRIAFNIGVGLPATVRLHALVLGEPNFFDV